MTSVRDTLDRLKREFVGLAMPVARPVYRTLRAVRMGLEAPLLRAKQARLVGKTIVITGSVGKSTATMLTRSILGDNVASTGGKNQVARFYRLIREIERPTDYIVQELSAYPAHHFDEALRAVTIDIGVVTRIGLDHASAFRDAETVAEVKGRLVEHIGASGFVCLNADDERCRAMASRTKARVIVFGTAVDADVRAEAVDATWPNRMSFDLAVAGKRRRVQTRLVGTLLLPSVLAALSVAHGLGLDLDAAVKRLAGADPHPKRLNVVEHPDGHTFLLDTHKASFWSTLALIDDMKNWGPTRRIFVLGEMSDVRNDSSRRYQQVMRLLADTSELVIGLGGYSESAARKVSAEKPNVIPASTLKDAARILREQPPSLVVLKSNGAVSLDGLAKRRRVGVR